MKKVAIGGFFHESNTFNPIITSREDFIIFEGTALYTQGDKYPSAQGIADYFKERKGYRILPLIFARAVPNGEISLPLYLELKARFSQLLGAEIPDIFVLPLHGSMRVEKIGSAESDLLQEIKRRYPEIPIVCALDMHATITDTMLENTMGLVGYKTAPHTDAWETGQHAAKLADMMLCEGKKLCMKAVKLPYLIAGEKSETECSPMRELIAALRHIEAQEGVLAASLLLGFPWADTPDNGVTAVVVSEGDPVVAELYAREIADLFEAKKADFGFSAEADEPLVSLRKALAESVKPVFVSDSGDNPTAGSTGDNNTVLALLSGELNEECRGKKILVAGIYDPRAVELCKGNIGKQIELQIGGFYDNMYSQDLRIKGVPRKHIPAFGAYSSELVLFQTAEYELIITSKHIGFTSVDMFEALALDYLDMDVIVVKLGYLTPDFLQIAAKHYLALSRGCTDELLERLSHSGDFQKL